MTKYKLKLKACLFSCGRTGSGGGDIPSHELPHQCQGEGGVAVVQILPTDAHQGELGLGLAQLHRVVTVL